MVYRSNIVHFRPPGIDMCSHVFKIGDIIISYKSTYKYLGLLGVLLNEFLDFSITESFLSDSAGRALGGIIGKFGAENLNYFIDMSDSRISKKIFRFDIRANISKTWGGDIRNLCADLDKPELIRNFQKINLDTVKLSINENDQIKWGKEIMKKPKLRSYVLFKNKREVEPFILSSVPMTPKKSRSTK